MSHSNVTVRDVDAVRAKLSGGSDGAVCVGGGGVCVCVCVCVWGGGCGCVKS